MLLRGLSDRESGNARQWFWLELASALPAPHPSRRARLYLLLIRWLGASRLLPLLHGAGVPAMALYQASHAARRARWQAVSQDALLVLGATLGLAAGFALLPASCQFLLWLVCVGALLISAWRTWRAPDDALNPGDGAEPLPGAEASLGLTAMLLARGCPAGTAPRLVALLRQNAAAALPLLMAALPELAETPMQGRWLRWRTALITWPCITLILSKINGYSHIPYNYLLCFVLLAGLALLLRQRWSQSLLLIGSWLGSAGLAWLVSQL